MCAGKNGEADHVHIFLQRRADNHFRSLPQASVNDLHPGIAQGAGDYFGPAVVAVKARLGHQYADFRLSHRISFNHI